MDSSDEKALEEAYLSAIEEVLREEMKERKAKITDLSRRLGYGSSFLNNALSPGPGLRPRLRVETLLGLLRLLRVGLVEFALKVERTARQQAGSPTPPPATGEGPKTLASLLQIVVRAWRAEAQARAGGRLTSEELVSQIYEQGVLAVAESFQGERAGKSQLRGSLAPAELELCEGEGFDELADLILEMAHREGMIMAMANLEPEHHQAVAGGEQPGEKR